MKYHDWLNEVADILPRITAWRRELHEHPEMSGAERETRERLTRWLGEIGASVTHFADCYGVMGTLENGEGKCIAIRADMDALPIREQTGLPFASRNPGVMHACGHDVHMALALGSCLWFAAHRDRWRGTVKWLFDPAEETDGYAQRMVSQGCMDNPDVAVILGQHINPNYPAGTFFCKPGFVQGASDELVLTVHGKSGHGAYPESGRDAIVIAAQIVCALQTLISRELSPFEPAALTFGTVSGGTARNIICGEVSLDGTLRTLSRETRETVIRRAREIAEGVASAMGGRAEIQVLPGYGPVYNDDAAYAVVEAAAVRLLGEEHIVRRPHSSLGVESFSFYLDHTPGVYYDIGSGLSTPLHTGTLLVDEKTLETGLILQIAAAADLLGGA